MATMANVDDPSQIQELDRNIQEYINKNIDSSKISLSITGMPFVNVHMDKAIIQSQFWSLVIALVFVFICMVLLQGSFIGGIIGLIPIAFTLIIIFGVMGLLGIRLNFVTVLVGSMISHLNILFNRNSVEV